MVTVWMCDWAPDGWLRDIACEDTTNAVYDVNHFIHAVLFSLFKHRHRHLYCIRAKRFIRRHRMGDISSIDWCRKDVIVRTRSWYYQDTPRQNVKQLLKNRFIQLQWCRGFIYALAYFWIKWACLETSWWCIKKLPSVQWRWGFFDYFIPWEPQRLHEVRD